MAHNRSLPVRTQSRTLAAPEQMSRRPVMAGLVAGLVAGLMPAAAPPRSQAERPPLAAEVAAESLPWIQDMLRRTEEKKEERRKERLNDYYRQGRNFRDYFQYEASSPDVA
ncbi:hypothetical protein V8C86DRAFT_2465500, partial [Haematococcus lacustris]